jgi:hypothetical protein
MVAVLSVVMDEAVAEKVAVVAPAGTVTDAGTDKAALLSEIETKAPPAGADPERVTVQVDEPDPVMVDGVQVNEDTVTAGAGTTTTPAEPSAVMELPAKEDAMVSPTATDRLRLAPVESVKFTEARTPFGIALAFRPVRRQVVEPGELLQYKVFDALAAEGPATTLTDEKSRDEYEKVH